MAHLDDDEDPAHTDYTPAVHALTDAGVPGALEVLPALEAPAEDTRLHAQRVCEGVLMRALGWIPGQGFPDGSRGDARARAELVRIGYDYDHPSSAAVARWRAWLEAH